MDRIDLMKTKAINYSRGNIYFIQKKGRPIIIEDVGGENEFWEFIERLKGWTTRL